MKNKKIERELSAIEHFVDKTIPFVVILLAILIIIDLFADIHSFEPWVTYADWLIVAFFVADLIFKWRHVKKLTKFIRLYWLDILAVFPFYLLFRTYFALAELLSVGERVKEAQSIAHEALLIREAKLLRETELITKETEFASKEAKLVPRMIRFVQRLLRFIWGSLNISHKHLVYTSKKQKI